MVNKERAQYFEWNPNCPVLHFTSDDMGFLPNYQNAAQAHANAKLADKNVQSIPRAEYDAWKAAQGEEQELVAEAAGGTTGITIKVPEKAVIADTDNDAVRAAKEKFNSLIDARVGLPTDATNPQKAAATRAITAARKELDALMA